MLVFFVYNIRYCGNDKDCKGNGNSYDDVRINGVVGKII